MNTFLENNFKKLFEVLNDCLLPKDGDPDNRPDGRELLHRINEFCIQGKVLINDKNNYKEFQTVLDDDKLSFLKEFFNYKINI